MPHPRSNPFADVSTQIAAGIRSLSSRVNLLLGRRRAMETVESEARLRFVLEATQLGVWDIDLATGAITRTTLHDRFFGYAEPRPSWSFDTFLEHVVPEERDAVRQSFEAAIEAGTTWDSECRIRQPGGSVRWIWMRGCVQPPARSGRAVSMCGTIADITERMELQAERERLLANERHARGEADWANNRKDELLATLSHDLRSPLQAILGWSRILRQGAANRMESERGLEIIERNANLQAQLIEDLLDMSRILSNALEFELEPNVDLTGVIDKAIQFIQPSAEAKGLVIRSVIPPGAIRVTGDARRLQQVLSNLLSNAVKFTARGGEVEVSLEVRAAEVEIRVRDTGCGIDREFLRWVLQRFRRQDSAATPQHRGLGLAIARQLVEFHGGSLGASSPGEGQGATFTVVLPAARAVQGAPQAAMGAPAVTPISLAGIRVLAKEGEPDARRLVPSGPRTEEERILVLDDELELRNLIARFLTREGYVVRCAATIPEAVQMASEFQPTLLIVDWLLNHGHDGADAVRAVREVLPEVKAIVMSGLPPEQVRSRLGDLEVLDVLEKPFQVGALFEQIQRALA